MFQTFFSDKRIKIIEDYSYEAVVINNEIVKGNYSRDSYNDFNTIIEYYDNGLVKSKQTIYVNPEITIKDIYFYDELGNETKQINMDSKGEVDTTSINEYYPNGNIKKWKHFSERRQITNETFYYYNNKELLIKSENFENNILNNYTIIEYLDNHKVLFYYDSNHVNIQKTIQNENSEEIHYLNEGKINVKAIISTNNGLRSFYKYINDNDIEYIVYEYNKNKDLISENIYINDFLDEIIEYKYKYDVNNNYIERIKYVNNIPKYIVTRKISYF